MNKRELNLVIRELYPFLCDLSYCDKERMAIECNDGDWIWYMIIGEGRLWHKVSYKNSLEGQFLDKYYIGKR